MPKKGCIKNRVGDMSYNNFGSKIIITKYNNSEDVDIFFPEYNWTAKNVVYQYFKRKTITCPYERRTYNIGYLGEGEYTTRINNKKTKAYIKWSSMIQRCYDPYELNRRPKYIDCYVCEEWHNFQNFAKWFYENYYECHNEQMHLDKDILIKNNKIYSPETCIFVPQRINDLFVKRDNDRGEYPLGIAYDKKNKRLVAKCSILINEKNHNKHLGVFPLNRPFQAFTCYKNFKENYIKQVADEYKNLIPKKLYEAMYKYEVEIKD